MNKPSTVTLSAIAAMSSDWLIGANHKLPWHLPADLAHFKAITTGKLIIMGRKTYESIGKPLPNRVNLILTNNHQFSAPGCEVIHTIFDAITYAITHHHSEIMVIGGAEIYKQLMPRCQRLYLTLIHAKFKGDAYFPTINLNEWHELSASHHEADAKNPYPYSFFIYARRFLQST